MTEFSAEHWRMRHEARYAQRLCERTARLYRKAATFATWLSIVGGSAAVSGAFAGAPAWLPLSGAMLLALVGGAAVAVRPTQRAAEQDADVRKYGELLRQAPTLDDAAFAEALAKARLSDSAEVEPLRDVAFNDVVCEVGRPDLTAPLRPAQRLLRVLA